MTPSRTSRRSGRRRVAAAGVLLVVVATTAAAVRATGSDGATDAPDAPDSASVLPVAAAGCPPVTDDLATTGPDRVLRGATVLRLCNGPGLVPVQAPYDVVTEGVDAFVELVDRAPLDRSEACTADGVPGLLVRLEHPGGRSQDVAVGLYGCRWVTVGGSRRRVADEALAELVRLFEQQRAGDEPDVDAPRVSCRAVTDEVPLSVIARPEDLARADLCVYPPAPGGGSQFGRGIAVPVPPADLALLRADLRDPVEADALCDPRAPTVTLVGTTAWGDAVLVPFDFRNPVVDDRQVGLRPASARAVERLVAVAEERWPGSLVAPGTRRNARPVRC